MERHVQREWLDDLPATAPEAIGSRRDLQRLNAWMAHPRLAWKALQLLRVPQDRLPQATPLPFGRGEGDTSPDCARAHAPDLSITRPSGLRPRLVELGAGDGTFLLQVARRLGKSWRGTVATLVDRQSLVAAETVRGFSDLGWQVQFYRSDVFEWCLQSGTERFDAVLANLFLHHLDQTDLSELLRLIGTRSRCFIAIEPRRSTWSLAFSKLVGVIGCNAVTRHDAPVSVQAGFSGRELSQMWNGGGEWILRERPAGLFSHLFCAWKRAGYRLGAL